MSRAEADDAERATPDAGSAGAGTRAPEARRPGRSLGSRRNGRKDDDMEARSTAGSTGDRNGGPAPWSRLAGGAALALAALCVLAVPAAAQQGGEDLAGPPMPDAPNQFRVSATVGRVGWDGAGDGEQEVEAATELGLDLETRMNRYLAFRFGGSYGRTTITGRDGEGTTRTVDANQIILELVAEPRLAVGPLSRTGVVPFAVAGLGSVVHDPRTEPGQFEPSLPTRSQGSLIYGAGVEASPEALGSLGVRVEWRRAEVQMQPLFVPTSREGTGRSSDRIVGSVYWSF